MAVIYYQDAIGSSLTDALAAHNNPEVSDSYEDANEHALNQPDEDEPSPETPATPQDEAPEATDPQTNQQTSLNPSPWR